jgi:hypothetical protein
MSTEKTHRTKFAVGHFLTERPDDPKSFRELAGRYADRLREVYFAWPGLLNGRAHLHKREHEAERIISDLKYCREHGMKLDLLANATCYGEKACTEEQRLQLTGIVERLASADLYPEIVTTTSPYIAKVFKVNFPDIEVRASVNMELVSTIALEYLSPLFDSFYIGRDVQRDLPTFHNMAAWCKAHGKKLCMLVNSGCMRNCPCHVFHETLQAHNFGGIFQEMFAQRLDFICHTVFRAKRFSDFLRCSWIRPEDVHVFEPELTTIKLSTRHVSYPFEIVEAYMNGSYDGDLLRLMDPYHGFFFRPDRIDNKSFPADWVTSGIGGLCAINCTHCGRCEKVLEQVMKYDLDHELRASKLSFNDNFSLLAPKHNVPDRLEVNPDFL